jgi:cardiolipin synthase (CMP-forming)
MWKNWLNLPNSLTILRVVLVPFFIYCLFIDELAYKIYALIIFIFASLTDFFDGYLARKWRQETEFGRFLDPLADKILVTSSFLTFLLLDEQIEIWMVLCIIFRDMLITCLRWIAIRTGTSLQTTMMGKLKTAFQMTAIFLLLILFISVSTKQRTTINEMYEVKRNQGFSGLQIANENYGHFSSYNFENFNWIDSAASFTPYYVMLITTIVTVFSGLRYFITNYKLLSPTVLKTIYWRNK